ncbi:MAG: hypothetical protein ACETWK_04595, partial [Candidatus Aminicenantaceae bacterium]
LRAIEESVAISLKTNRLMPFLKRLLHRFALRNDKASRHFGTNPIITDIFVNATDLYRLYDVR